MGRCGIVHIAIDQRTERDIVMRRHMGEDADGVEVAYRRRAARGERRHDVERARSEEHTSELQSLMRISYAVFCLKKQNKQHDTPLHPTHCQQPPAHTATPSNS